MRLTDCPSQQRGRNGSDIAMARFPPLSVSQMGSFATANCTESSLFLRRVLADEPCLSQHLQHVGRFASMRGGRTDTWAGPWLFMVSPARFAKRLPSAAKRLALPFDFNFNINSVQRSISGCILLSFAARQLSTAHARCKAYMLLAYCPVEACCNIGNCSGSRDST